MGNRFVDGWLDPALHQAGVAGGRILAVIQRRPCPSNIELCTSLRLVPRNRAPKAVGGFRFGPAAGGGFGARRREKRAGGLWGAGSGTGGVFGALLRAA